MKPSIIRPITLLAGIIILAALLRGLFIESIPPGLHPDAAANAIDAWQAYTSHHRQVFYEANFGREGLLINLISYSFQFFGPTIFAYKLPSVILGILTVVGMYFLGRVVRPKSSLGLYAAFFTATSFWMIVFERTGLRATLSVACIVGTSIFFILSLRHQRWWWYVLTGIFLGLGLHTYIAFRLMPIVLMCSFGYYLWLQHQQHISLRATLANHWAATLTVLSTLAVVWPLAGFFIEHPSYIMGRANDVSVFTQPHPWKLLLESTIANLSIFSFFGDPNWRHTISTQPLLDAIQSVLLIIGFRTAWHSLRHRNDQNQESDATQKTVSFYFLVLFVLMIIPAATTYSPGGIPHALRIIDTAPAIYIFIAWGAITTLEWAKHTWSHQRTITSITVACMVFWIATPSIDLFTTRWGLNRQVAHEYSQDFTNLSTFINDQSKLGSSMYLANTASEVFFLTINTSHLFRSTHLVLSDITSQQPKYVISTTGQPDDLVVLEQLRKQGWRDFDGLLLGAGNHPIQILQHQ